MINKDGYKVAVDENNIKEEVRGGRRNSIGGGYCRGSGGCSRRDDYD